MKAKDLSYVKIYDDSNHHPRFDRDGGKYRYITELFRVGERFQAEHSTSSGFDYCPVYAEFRSCESCRELDENSLCTASLETFSIEEVQELIDKCNGDIYISDFSLRK